MLRRAATPDPAARSALEAALTDDERAHRDRFHRAADADRFLVGRGTLRLEVARRTGAAPHDLAIERGVHGKPWIRGGPHVNVAHSGDVVVVALCSAANVGIDVEQVGEAHEPYGAFFSDPEVRAMRALPNELQVPAFFHTWTSREAIMKLTGLGMQLQRDGFDVDVDPRRPPALIKAWVELVEPLSLCAIEVAPGHAAALAVAAAAGAYRVAFG